MQCPRDSTSLSYRDVGPVMLHACATCGGIWMTQQALTVLVEYASRGPDADHVREWEKRQRPAETKKVHAHSEPALSCPHGHGHMRRHPYAGNVNIWIDRCELCAGLWFDGWELMDLWRMVGPHPTHDALVKAFGDYSREMHGDQREIDEFLNALSMMARAPQAAPIIFLVYLAQITIRDLMREYRGE